LEALNHGVAGADRGRRAGPEVASDVRATGAAALVLPKSINGVGASRRAKGNGNLSLLFSPRGEGGSCVAWAARRLL